MTLFLWPQHDATNCNHAKHMSLAPNVGRDTPLSKPTESKLALVLTRGVQIELLVKRPEA
jgi:hypothetical protein